MNNIVKMSKIIRVGLILAMIVALECRPARAEGILNDADGEFSFGRRKAAVDCGRECGRRCSKAAVRDRCLKYCGICCNECKCVPPGTFGNKDRCPCYRDKKNSKGKPKCP